ncbi:MAG: class II fructose-bisphosphate aldolase, partial [Patescibacteria group bacterium]
VSEGEREFIGVAEAVAMVKALKKELGIDIFLNADHTHSLEKVKEAAAAGFDAIVFDVSKLPLDENIKMTKEAVKAAKSINKNILIEGELGYIGAGSEVIKELPKDAAISSEFFTKPEEASRFVLETGVDLLAPAVGNIHGIIEGIGNPALDILRIEGIKNLAKKPLVLHGGSGIKDEDFLSAIAAGVSIIHISTELRVAWRAGLEKDLKKMPNEVAPYKIMADSVEEMKKVVEGRLRLFNRIG